MTTRDEAVTAVEENTVDLVTVDVPAISNPNLVTYRNKGAKQNKVDRAT